MNTRTSTNKQITRKSARSVPECRQKRNVPNCRHLGTFLLCRQLGTALADSIVEYLRDYFTAPAPRRLRLRRPGHRPWRSPRASCRCGHHPPHTPARHPRRRRPTRAARCEPSAAITGSGRPAVATGTPHCIEHAVLRTRKATGDEHQLRRHLVLGARNAFGLAGRPIQIDHAQARGRALLVQQHLERVHAPSAHLAAHGSDSLLLAVVGLLHVGPLRPGVARRALIGRSRQELKLAHAARALAHGGAHAVVAGIAAANDHNVQATRIRPRARRRRAPRRSKPSDSPRRTPRPGRPRS